MNLFDRIRRAQAEEQRLSLNGLVEYMKFSGVSYPFAPQYSMTQSREEIDNSFSGMVSQVYLSDGVVFACVMARQLLFSEARFQFQRVRAGKLGDLWSNQDLQILENPWPGGKTRDLLTRALQDVDLGGNFYAVREGNRLMRLRPDWVEIFYGSKKYDNDPNAPDIEVAGYVYYPGGKGNSRLDPIFYLPEQVAHWAPTPHPMQRGLGVSWIGPIIEEVAADKGATTHKRRFFDNAATPNLAISFPEGADADTAERFIKNFEESKEGAYNAYRTLFMGAGADIKVVGADMRQLDFKVTQGHGETRVCAAARVPPIIVGVSEGLEAATYSNYSQARRAFADQTMRPLWGSFCEAISAVVRVPSDSQLAYDGSHISFLQEDQKDAAEIQQTKANTIRTYIEAGFDPKTVVDAIEASDLGRLNHTGLVSVQLQPPGSDPNAGGDSGAAPAAAALPKPPDAGSGGAAKQIPAKTGRVREDTVEAVRGLLDA